MCCGRGCSTLPFNNSVSGYGYAGPPGPGRTRKQPRLHTESGRQPPNACRRNEGAGQNDVHAHRMSQTVCDKVDDENEKTYLARTDKIWTSQDAVIKTCGPSERSTAQLDADSRH
eukprot:scaffold22998_cov129-Isochrysis_galbana.AAC.3